MAVPYNYKAIEQKWRKNWEEHPVNVEDGNKPKYYCLDMFPYPSGNGLHVGHWRGYVISDVWSRFKMMQGYYLIHPMGWDAFGLPAENYAIKMGVHPAKSTADNRQFGFLFRVFHCIIYQVTDDVAEMRTVAYNDKRFRLNIQFDMYRLVRF